MLAEADRTAFGAIAMTWLRLERMVKLRLNNAMVFFWWIVFLREYGVVFAHQRRSFLIA
jgi:hypothetical protein